VLVGALIVVIIFSFTTQLVLSRPQAIPLLTGFLPSPELLTNKEMLFIGVGIIGATVMPHNLFLHSSIILTRNIARDEASIKQAIHFGTIDSTVSLVIALFVNACILMVAAATFHRHGYEEVATLEDAHRLLDPILKSGMASVLFAIALLASGQNSTLTGTLTGQIVMEGFMTWKIPPAVRRLGTRLLAIVPSVICVAVGGDSSANYLLILSQVVLSFALPFAIIPLVHISSSKSRMGVFVNSWWVKVLAVAVSSIIVALNIVLLI
jgi:manganese transport protein